MNRDERNPETMLDNAITGIRNEEISAETLENTRRRAWDRISDAAQHGMAKGDTPVPENRPSARGIPEAPHRITSCSDFQALLPDYLAGTLPEGRRLLVEDHTHECVACRRALHTLSQPAPRVLAIRERHAATPWRKYAIAASLVITAGLAGWRAFDYFTTPAGSRAVVQSASGNVFRLAGGVFQPLTAGAEIQETDILRTAPGAHLMLKLRDGSMVEVGERAEFTVAMKRSDTTLKLDRGAVIVQAAKRREGHLYVASADCRVAVTGTVFSVNRGMKGSRVSVVEGSVEVEHGGRDVTLRSGDQVATDASMASIPITDEISWSRNYADHIALLNELTNLKSKLDQIRLPELRYGSRLLPLLPAHTAVFVSVPNMGQALSEAYRLFLEQIRFSPVLQQWWSRGGQQQSDAVQRTVETIRRVSEYLGEEVVVALAPNNALRETMPVVLAEIHRPGFREFLTAELTKLDAEHGASGFQIFDGQLPVQGKAGPLVLLKNNYVVAGGDAQAIQEIARNIDGAGPRSFASTEFGRRLSGAFRQGTGALIGFDLPSLASFEGKILHGGGHQESARALGADRIRYLIVEQKSVGNQAQRSVELSFAGERSGIASWLGAPAAIGGLNFVSPDAQILAAAVLKKPEQVVDDLLALHPDITKIFEEARRHLRIDLKQDIAASLGGEITFAIDGPLVPVPSWKVVLDVTNPGHLQQSLEKVVNAANLVVQLSGGQGYKLDSEVRNEAIFKSGPLTYYVIRSLDPSPIPEIHYVYIDGYLVMAPSRGLLIKAMQNRQSGVTLARSDRFRQMLPRDGYANASAILYQNGGTSLGTLATALGGQLDGQIAAKVSPMLVCAYGGQDRIEIVNKGSAWDVVMGAVLGPALHFGTRQPASSYR